MRTGGIMNIDTRALQIIIHNSSWNGVIVQNPTELGLLT